MLMLSRIRDHLSHLRLCNFISEDATNSFALGMYLKHNPSCFGAVHREKTLQDIDHELHRSVVVINENYLIERRSFKLGCRFLDDQARSVPPAFNIAHEFSVYRARLSGLQDMLFNRLKGVTCSVMLNKPLLQSLSPNYVTLL